MQTTRKNSDKDLSHLSLSAITHLKYALSISEKELVKRLSKLKFVYHIYNDNHYNIEGINYWRTTGKWIDKKNSGRGFHTLVEHIENRIYRG